MVLSTFLKTIYTTLSPLKNKLNILFMDIYFNILRNLVTFNNIFLIILINNNLFIIIKHLNTVPIYVFCKYF